ncbi:hypothetical protein U1Q18_011938, partial [Sarracenia purpurea var. burkii]
DQSLFKYQDSYLSEPVQISRFLPLALQLLKRVTNERNRLKARKEEDLRRVTRYSCKEHSRPEVEEIEDMREQE